MVLECKPIRVLLGLVFITACILLIKGYSYISHTSAILNFISNTTTTLAHLGPDVPQRNFTCVKGEQLAVVMECRPCSPHEAKIFSDICRISGNLEKLKCGSGREIMLSCPIAYSHESTRFWLFEGVMIGVALVSNLAVWWRRRTLDRRFYQRLKRQISDSGF